MRCLTCRRLFKEGDKVMAVGVITENAKRGDFVAWGNSKFVHLKCPPKNP